MRTILIAALVLLSACALQRENQLRDQMDNERAACGAGDQGACERYKLVLQQYRAESAVPRCGLLGLPCPGAMINIQAQ
jgi:hypothetical protein